jgi:Zn-dependent metalloprotease
MKAHGFLLLLVGACAVDLDSTATRTDELSTDVKLVEVERRRLDDGREQAKYAVHFQGIPIAQLGRRAALDEKGEPRFRRKLVLTEVARKVDVAKDVGEELAVKVASKHALAEWKGEPFAITHKQRVLYPRLSSKPGFIIVEQLQLAYVVDISDDVPTPLRRMRYVLAAADGAIVAVIDPREEIVGNGNGYHLGATPIQIEPTPGELYTLVDSRRARAEDLPGITTWNFVEGDCTGDCGVSRFVDSDTTFGSGVFALDASASDEDLQTAGVDAHRGVELYWDFVEALYGRVGPLDVDASVDAVVNVPIPAGVGQTTAWFDPLGFTSTVSRGRMFFSLPFMKGHVPLTMVDAVGHELTHAMTMRELTIWNDDPLFGGSDKIVNEGLADVFGMMLKLWHQGGGGSSIPNTGGVWMIGNAPGFHARYFHKPSLDARLVNNVVVQSSDAYPPVDPDDDPHRIAGIVRRAFYFLARGLPGRAKAPLDQWEEYGSPFLERGLVGVGNDTAALIFYRAIVNELDLRPDLDELRGGVTFEAARIYGHCSDEHKAATDAFAAVNLGAPADREPPVAAITVVQGSGELIVTTTASDASGSPLRIADVSVDGFWLASHASFETTKVTRVPTDFLAQLPWPTHVFRFTVEDDCRNRTEHTFDFTGDVMGPAISITDEIGPGVNRKLVRVTARDPSGLLDARIDLGGISQTLPISGTVATVETTIDFASLPHGSTPLVVRVRDGFGNATQVTRATFLDRLPPATCQLELLRTEGYNIVVRALTSDADSGPRDVELGLEQTVHHTLDATSGTTSTRTLIAPNTGSHVAFARCYDRHGNSVRTERTVDVSRMPTATIAVSSLSRTSATFSFQAGDDLGLAGWQLHYACPDTNALTLLTSQAFPAQPPTTSTTGSRTLALSNFAGGTRCRARVTATDHHANTYWTDVPFTIAAPPPPPLVTMTESEPNNTIQQADPVASNVDRINAVSEKEWWQVDYFRIDLAPGRSATVGYPLVGCVLRTVVDAFGTNLQQSGELMDTTIPQDWASAGITFAKTITNVTNATKPYYLYVYRIASQPPFCNSNSVPYHYLVRRN